MVLVLWCYDCSDPKEQLQQIIPKTTASTTLLTVKKAVIREFSV